MVVIQQELFNNSYEDIALVQPSALVLFWQTWVIPIDFRSQISLMCKVEATFANTFRRRIQHLGIILCWARILAPLLAKLGANLMHQSSNSFAPPSWKTEQLQGFPCFFIAVRSSYVLRPLSGLLSFTIKTIPRKFFVMLWELSCSNGAVWHKFLKPYPPCLRG